MLAQIVGRLSDHTKLKACALHVIGLLRSTNIADYHFVGAVLNGLPLTAPPSAFFTGRSLTFWPWL